MATIEIKPFGNNENMPSGYPISNNLDTHSAQKALSAEQGTVLKDLIGVPFDAVVNCLGDSITEGWIGPGSASPTWCQQIAAKLHCTVNNYGVGGTGICNSATFQPFETRLNAMTETTIDALIIFGGFNDYHGQLAASLGTINSTPALGSNFFASFKHLIEAAKTKYPSAAIGIITPMRSRYYEANNKGISLEDVVNAEIEVAAYYGIQCYDFFHDGGITVLDVNTWTSDGIHPNQNGINKWLAPQFSRFVANLLSYKTKNAQS